VERFPDDHFVWSFDEPISLERIDARHSGPTDRIVFRKEETEYISALCPHELIGREDELVETQFRRVNVRLADEGVVVGVWTGRPPHLEVDGMLFRYDLSVEMPSLDGAGRQDGLRRVR